MASPVTVNSRTDAVFGNKRAILANVDIAADGDTFVSGLHLVEFVSATSATNAAIGATVSGGTVALQTGGAEAGVFLEVLGL